jgi:site-specific DNA-methyltransferase (adenine-specific)
MPNEIFDTMIVSGDARRLTGTADQSVQLAVTSPPYWELKDYCEGAIGYGSSYERYINDLNHVWAECARVLAPGGRLCVNIGDQFARAAYYGRYKVVPIRTEIIRMCETLGLDHMGAIIWQKVTTCNSSGGGAVMGSYPYPTNGIVKLDYEFILLFRKLGKRPRVSPQIKEASRLTAEQWNTYFQGHWHFPGVRQKQHLAAFPEELPRRLIRMFSFAGDLVLDPFLGSGTTALVAHQEGRRSVGYEIDSAAIAVAKSRLAESGASTQVVSQTPQATPPDGTLPYVFKDPVRITARQAKKARRFGSKVDGTEGPRESYRTVTAVIDHRTLELDGAERVSLLGLGERLVPPSQARRALEELCLKKRVFLKRPGPADSAGYVYLKNRTFVNARAIRTGLAAPGKAPHTHRTRFERYHRERVVSPPGQ